MTKVKSSKEPVETTTNLESKLLSLKTLSLNGDTYLGRLEVNEGGTIIKDAMLVEESDFNSSIKSWIKLDNLGDLSDITFRGENFSIAEKNFSREQIHSIKLISLDVEYKMETAIRELQNSKI